MFTRMLVRVWKRCFDLMAAIAVLLAFSPLLLLISIAIMSTSEGPAFFLQERIGRRGRIFRIAKFRTMIQNAPDIRNPDGSAFSSDGDPRVTRIGKILRKSSLDELPQLWNVVRGQMSLIGPRPELPEGTQTYRPSHFRRLNVRPGMTGWAVVHGRNEVPVDMRRDLDTWYADHAGFWLDLKIIGKTIAIVARSKGINRAAATALHDAPPEGGLEVQQCSTES